MSSFPPTRTLPPTDLGPEAGGIVTLPELLNQAIERLAEFGPEYTSDCQKLQALHQRLAEERFHLAVLGQFKRGKSTLLNALLGADLLPTSVIPLTAIPTFIRPGPKLAVRITYQNGRPADTFNELQFETLTGYLNGETRQELTRARGYCRKHARGRQILSQAKEIADL